MMWMRSWRSRNLSRHRSRNLPRNPLAEHIVTQRDASTKLSTLGSERKLDLAAKVVSRPNGHSEVQGVPCYGCKNCTPCRVSSFIGCCGKNGGCCVKCRCAWIRLFGNIHHFYDSFQNLEKVCYRETVRQLARNAMQDYCCCCCTFCFI